MSEQFGLPPVPLMTPEKAQEIARGLKAVADSMRAAGVRAAPDRLERESQWWLTYAISLAQTPRDQG
ncbi:MAG: hypothetical protein JO110_03760 [Acetobacteraceae bacterium]|nr:hypothetical protein [Acetobacteraceae bacterium]